MVKKTILVHGHNVLVEHRACAYCAGTFWAKPETSHSVCRKECWELHNGKMWRRGEKLPKIRYPGEEIKKRDKKKDKSKGHSMRDLIDAGWTEATVKKSYAARVDQLPQARREVLKFH